MVFQAFFGPRPVQHLTKWPQKLTRKLPEWSSEDGLSYQRLSWTVLVSIWGGLGVDAAPFGLHLSSNLAPKNDPEQPKSAQETSKSAQEPPKTAQDSPRASQERQRRPRSSPRAAQESPRAAEDSPRASQKPTKMPRSSPRLTRAPPRSCQEPGPKPRSTHDLKKLPTSPRTSLELLSSPQSGRNQKRAAAVLPTRGLHKILILISFLISFLMFLMMFLIMSGKS